MSKESMWQSASMAASLTALALVALQAQGSASCGADSAFARRYGAHLQQTFRMQEYTPKTRVQWLPDSAACHAAVRASSSEASATLFVYSFADADVIQYGIVSVPASHTQGSPSVCFYDAAWRRRGVCLAEVQ